MSADYADLRVMADYVRPDSVVFDVGASVGNYSLAAARAVGSGMVIALEPHPIAFQELVNSTFGARIAPLNLAASDEEGWKTLSAPATSDGAASQLSTLENRADTHGDVESMRVRTIRLDSLASGTFPTSVIKVDVEGHEAAVLRGATEILRADHPVLIVEIEKRHLRNSEVHDVVEWVQALGYRTFGISTHHLIPWHEFDLQRDQLQWLRVTGDETTIADATHYVNNFLFIPNH